MLWLESGKGLLTQYPMNRGLQWNQDSSEKLCVSSFVFEATIAILPLYDAMTTEAVIIVVLLMACAALDEPHYPRGYLDCKEAYFLFQNL
ncbi:hypothetical protein TNCV_151431 [Trichonephila clavipes]|uniref:Uncharacterized protein n=1 Tax=Trichonephila clavipes TaxID=2585209 RepID=A0A8X6RIT2_TRICX|nr:hypothetical protein TNCV_151431 [Trichonephila clavipes]